MNRVIGGLVVVVLAGMYGAWHVAPPGRATGRVAAAESPRWTGTGSCAAAACHNGNGAKGSKGSEYSTWATCDKHANAYIVLTEKKSKIIERNLNHPGADWSKVEAEKDRLCLKCHALKDEAQPLRQPDLLGDGVGCENCHGRAERWLADHFRPEWKSKTAKEKATFGFEDLSVGNLVGRAKACVDCHVGNGPKEMEVNHDLIAAGHPRLNFEFAAYLANYPKHWNEERDKKQVPDLEARAWTVGQFVSAEAAVNLLAYRADEKNPRWPEFAEYDCFACHHDLRASEKDAAKLSWRQQRGFGARRPGELAWGTWYLAMTPGLLRQPADAADNRLAAPVEELAKVMARPFPVRANAANQASRLAPLLAAAANQANKKTFDRAAVLQTLDWMEQLQRTRQFATWDAEAQLYLRFAAMYHGLKDLDPAAKSEARFQETLDAMLRDLRFPANYDSPRDFQPKTPERQSDPQPGP